MRILVLGGYGLIGTHVVGRLLGDGHELIGLGRDIRQAGIQTPQVKWIAADLGLLTTAAAWGAVLRLADAQAIVNCAGALQDGTRDDVGRVQSAAMRALYSAAPAFAIEQLIQISAPRSNPHGETAFMRSKGAADAALQDSTLDWVILRPGLVFSPQAYGGTALLRALAACPWVQPMAYGDRLLQTVCADDVAGAVSEVLSGRVATRRIYDLVEDKPRSLREVIGLLRAWLGIPPAPEVIINPTLILAAARVADGLGWLGWRSPMRTTAITELAAGITGNPAAWRTQTGRPLASLEATLRQLPATIQERWYARAFMLKPVIIAVLSVFWTATGVVALANPQSAARVLTSRGLDDGLALTIVVSGVAMDLILGLAVISRNSMPWAAKGMIAVTLAYLIGGTLLTPDLWLDPLGPLVKAIPALALALVALALEGDR